MTLDERLAVYAAAHRERYGHPLSPAALVWLRAHLEDAL